jgi:hypothetical protein
MFRGGIIAVATVLLVTGNAVSQVPLPDRAGPSTSLNVRGEFTPSRLGGTPPNEMHARDTKSSITGLPQSNNRAPGSIGTIGTGLLQ